MVVVDKSAAPKKVLLIELTVPCDSAHNFKAALERKTARYKGSLHVRKVQFFNIVQTGGGGVKTMFKNYVVNFV